MQYRYVTVDVFTRHAFGGNPLAVVTDAKDLSDQQMQAIAREFNYSESTFVLPAEAAQNDARVRIFTPAREVPFAGHPNVGTAFVLASDALARNGRAPQQLVFEEQAGLVPMAIHSNGDGISGATVTAPQSLTTGRTIDAASIAAVLSIDASRIATADHQPLVASVGLAFIIVELKDSAAVADARVDRAVMETMGAIDGADAVCVYARDPTDSQRLHVRMFAPLHGVEEDPATGSANAALMALRAKLAPTREGELSYRSSQGSEMGRPSELVGTVEKVSGEVATVRVGGSCVKMMEGSIIVP